MSAVPQTPNLSYDAIPSADHTARKGRKKRTKIPPPECLPLPSTHRSYRPPREYLTTGQVSHLCGVSTRTATKWIDTGLLVGTRLAGSQDRRVHWRDFEAFARAHGYGRALDRILGPRTVAVLGIPAALAANVRDRLKELPPVVVAADGFELGMLVERLRPGAVVLDASVGRMEILAIAERLLSVKPSPGIVILFPEDQHTPTDGLGVCYLRHPVVAEELVRRLESLLGA